MAQYYHDSYYQQKPSLFGDKRILYAVIGAVAVVIIIATLLLVNSGNGGIKSDFSRLSVRYNGMVQFVNTNKGKLQNADLIKASADANILFTSDSATFTRLLSSKYSVTKIDEQITKSEVDSTSAGELKEAELLGKFDQTYQALLLEKLDKAEVQLAKTYQGAKGTEVRTALQAAQININQVREQVEAVRL